MFSIKCYSYIIQGEKYMETSFRKSYKNLYLTALLILVIISAFTVGFVKTV